MSSQKYLSALRFSVGGSGGRYGILSFEFKGGSAWNPLGLADSLGWRTGRWPGVAMLRMDKTAEIALPEDLESRQ